MVENIADGEVISQYRYNGKVYHLEIFYSESGFVHAYAYFQVDVDLETDAAPGVGEHPYDRERAIRSALKNLLGQYN